MANNILIRNEECERVVLGTILNYPDTFYPVQEYLSKDCFYCTTHQEIYIAILRVAESGGDISILTVSQELGRMESKISIFDLSQLVLYNKSFGDIEHYALMLRDYARQRACLPIASRLIDLSQREVDDVDEAINAETNKLTLLLQDGQDNISSMRDTMEGLYDTINKNIVNNKSLSGTPTGFEKIDDKGGLQGGDLIIVAGDTSMGKSSFAVKLTMEAIKSNCGVAFYSMEMNQTQLVARMISMESGITSSRILYDKLNDEEIPRIDKAVGTFLNAPLFFDDKSTNNIDNILCSIRRMVAKYHIKGVVVDYLQILSVNTKSSNIEQQMGDCARKLKNIAKELNIWTIALSQLNRDSVNPVPSLSRLRSSGQIGEAADVIILLYRPEYYGKSYPEQFLNIDTHNTCMVDVAKGRNIGTFKFICGFIPELTKFYPIEPNLLPKRSAIISHNDDNPF